MKTGQLSRQALLWQLLSVIAATLLHVSHIPWWVSLLVVITVGWRFLVYTGRWSFPPWWVKALFVIGAAVGVLVSYKAGGGISATVTLLIVGFGLKVIELYKQRDSYVILFVAYLVTATQFLFSQNMLMAVYIFLTLTIVTTALLNANLNRDMRFFSAFKRVFWMLLPAYPLMIVLFIGMPRLGPIWDVGLDKSMAKTGLSDSMSPGDITRLTRSAEVAFRVSFDERAPSQTQLYWRAIVLNDFDGRRWFNDEGPLKVDAETIIAPNSVDGVNSPIWHYELILEPTQRQYIPTLDYLSFWDKQLFAHSDFTLTSKTAQTSRNQFSLSSQMRAIEQDRKSDSFARELQLPQGNDRAKDLARRWLRETGNPNDFIARIEKYFNQEFSYSLEPPGLGLDSVSEFLFDSKVGFCGHFAGATVFLLREAGIPARVVTGYQGGEWNAFQNYYVVRQYDAHAWVEAWLPEKGWVRLDPTAWVAPERVQAPAEDTLSKDQAFLKDNLFMGWGLTGNGLIANVRMRLEAINYGWHRWVLNYHHQQKNVLQQLLGSFSITKLALFIFVPFCAVIGFTVLMLLRNARKVTIDPLNKQLQRLSIYFSDFGFERSKGETIGNYCHRLANKYPTMAVSLAELSQLFEKVQYAEQRFESEDEIELIKAQVECCIKEHSRI